MAYKQIKVWDGSTWQNVGAQVPAMVQAFGTDSITLSSGTGSKTITYTNPFNTTPLVFVQITGSNNAQSRVSGTATNFTVTLTGTGTDVVTFSWFAVLTS